jgi:hypothetical protein
MDPLRRIGMGGCRKRHETNQQSTEQFHYLSYDRNWPTMSIRIYSGLVRIALLAGVFDVTGF